MRLRWANQEFHARRQAKGAIGTTGQTRRELKEDKKPPAMILYLSYTEELS